MVKVPAVLTILAIVIATFSEYFVRGECGDENYSEVPIIDSPYLACLDPVDGEPHGCLGGFTRYDTETGSCPGESICCQIVEVTKMKQEETPVTQNTGNAAERSLLKKPQTTLSALLFKRK